MVEVFKTNLCSHTHVRHIISILRRHILNGTISVDLEDCDKVLRIETPQSHIPCSVVIEIFRKHGFEAELL